MAKNESISISDLISEVQGNTTPEEMEAVQVFSRQLVEDYGYPKEPVQTRPQYRTKVVLRIQKKNILWTLLYSLTNKKMMMSYTLLLSVKRETEKTA
ncbi:MAG: hypothetical protein FWD66_04990 [Paludibacter sp.]|nr:hypothetical protein [Paludibacter sp.]